MSTNIQWTQETWNSVVGCTKVSPGCLNRYAERMANRLAAMGQEKYEKVVAFCSDINDRVHNGKHIGWNNQTYCDESALEKPLHWKKPRRIFVCSMGDLFHESVPFEFIDKVFDVMLSCPQHTFQVLTKRPEIALDYYQSVAADQASVGEPNSIEYAENIWFGCTAENQEWWNKRKEDFFSIPATVHFVSNEPLLGAIQYTDEDLKRLGWIIVGAESGPGARYCPVANIWDIVEQCKAITILVDVPVFVKQIHLSGNTKAIKDIKQFPKGLQIREYPNQTKKPTIGDNLE